MKVLLDENFPLGLLRVLQAEVQQIAESACTERLYELMDDGGLLPWREISRKTQSRHEDQR